MRLTVALMSGFGFMLTNFHTGIHGAPITQKGQPA
jgi:hypothetical protein